MDFEKCTYIFGDFGRLNNIGNVNGLAFFLKRLKKESFQKLNPKKLVLGAKKIISFI